MTFIIVCTGTAGHINPALVIAQQLKSRLPESEIVFIGAGRDMEKRLIPQAGFELINIKMSGIKRGIRPRDILHNIKTVHNLLHAQHEVAAILKTKKPDAVIGTGGYICYPVLKAAARRRIPTFLHESNALPGLAVKMLSGIVDKVMITYPGFDEHYKRPERVIITGTPVRFSSPRCGLAAENESSREAHDKPLVLSFWGSLGAEGMNELMAGFIKRNLSAKAFRHVHAAGNSKDKLEKKMADLGVTDVRPPLADIRSYIDDMPEMMSKADLVLCRAGGITLAELAFLGKPAILIPSAYVPDNVQSINARQFEKIGAAAVLDEAKCDSDSLFEAVNGLVADRAKLREMSQAAKTLAAPDAAERIGDLILEGIESRS